MFGRPMPTSTSSYVCEVVFCTTFWISLYITLNEIRNPEVESSSGVAQSNLAPQAKCPIVDPSPLRDIEHVRVISIVV